MVDEITKDGKLKNVQFYYEHLDDDEEREVEELVLLYLDIYKKTLLEIENQIPTQLYGILDARILSAMDEDKNIKIQELLSICVSITPKEMDRTLEVANRNIFHNKHRIVSLMLGKVNEIVNETHKAWVKFFAANHGFHTSSEPKIDTKDIMVEGKGKGIMGTSPSILKNIKILDIEPQVETNIHTNVEILAELESVKVASVHVTNVEDNSPLDLNV